MNVSYLRFIYSTLFYSRPKKVYPKKNKQKNIAKIRPEPTIIIKENDGLKKHRRSRDGRGGGYTQRIYLWLTSHETHNFKIFSINSIFLRYQRNSSFLRCRCPPVSNFQSPFINSKKKKNYFILFHHKIKY